MKTHFRKIVAAILVGAATLGSTAALAGDAGDYAAKRAKLEAEWAEARARNAANPDASLVERLFGGRPREKRIATAPGAEQPN